MRVYETWDYWCWRPGTVKRDTWTSKFGEIVFALDFPSKSAVTPVDPQTERIPGESVHIPDSNLRAAIAGALGEAPNAQITVAEMATLERLELNGKHISDLTGLEFAINLNWLNISNNNISNLSPIEGLIKLSELRFASNHVSDLSPLKGLIKSHWTVVYGKSASIRCITTRGLN